MLEEGRNNYVLVFYCVRLARRGDRVLPGAAAGGILGAGRGWKTNTAQTQHTAHLFQQDGSSGRTEVLIQAHRRLHQWNHCTRISYK